MSFLGSGAGDLSTSTALPTRYLFYFTRLSRPTESRDWGEARGQSRARARKSLDSTVVVCSTLMRLYSTKSSIYHVRDGAYRQTHTACSFCRARYCGTWACFSGPPRTYVCTCTTRFNQAAHALTASEDRIHPCPWIHAMSDACGGGRYPATWACFDKSSLHHRRNTAIHAYADCLA